MRTLIAFLLLTATVSAEWTTAKPSTPFVTAKPACPCCISGCDCPAGECDCGKLKAGLSKAAKANHIKATVALNGCPPCIRWERECAEALEAKGWNIEIVRVPLGSESVPHFEYKGRKLDGYGGRDEFYGWLKASLPTGTPAGVVATSQAASVGFTQPAPVQYRTVVRSDMHEHRCPCGNTWSHSDSMNGNTAAHTCPRCHRQVWRQSSSVARVRVPVRNPVQYAYRQPARVMRSCPTCPGR